MSELLTSETLAQLGVVLGISGGLGFGIVYLVWMLGNSIGEWLGHCLSGVWSRLTGRGLTVMKKKDILRRIEILKGNYLTAVRSEIAYFKVYSSSQLEAYCDIFGLDYDKIIFELDSMAHKPSAEN